MPPASELELLLRTTKIQSGITRLRSPVGIRGALDRIFAENTALSESVTFKSSESRQNV